MKTLTVTVTREDIRNGHKQDCFSCPVALAINRLVKCSVHAELREIRFISFNTHRRFEIKTPPEVIKFMNRFDYTKSRKSIRPITFTLIHPQLPL